MINLIKVENLKEIEVNETLINEIKTLMTPKEILSYDVFPNPKIISPEIFTSFNLLLEYKYEIQTLKLVPIKDDATHAIYNGRTDKSEMIKAIEDIFKDTPIFLLQNQYPYWLPSDLVQYIVWLKNNKEEEILDFIAKCIKYLEIEPKDVILFERPLNTQQKLVKGTFPDYRHIHFWINKNQNNVFTSKSN